MGNPSKKRAKQDSNRAKQDSNSSLKKLKVDNESTSLLPFTVSPGTRVMILFNSFF
jgi:hypothetical protein